MVEYKRYPEYIDSGVEWLGEIPSAWKASQLKKNVSLISQKGNVSDFTLALENIESWTGNLLGSFSKEYETTGILFSKGDILFGKLRPYLAKVWHADRDGSAVGDFYSLRPKGDYYSPYLRYLLASSGFIELVNSSTYGAKMPRVGWSFMGNIQCPLPNITTQQQIVSFLDSETKKIDASVASMESLISLLTEKRTALISETVTRGILGEHTEFKDSGVEWLEDIPASWGRKNLGGLAQWINGFGFKPEDLNGTDLRVVRIKELLNPHIQMDKTDLKIPSKYYLTNGDLVYSWSMTLATHIWDRGEALLNQHLYKVVPVVGVETRWLRYSLDGAFPVLSNLMHGSAAKHITKKNLLSFRIALPPLEEQNRICYYLDQETTKIDTTVKEAKTSIKLLKEKRQTLISDAVTGKIDVTSSVN